MRTMIELMRGASVAAAVFLSGAGLAFAQDMKLYTPQPEHEVLKRFEGEWRFEKLVPSADGSAIDTLGTGEVLAELLGGFFVVGEWSGNVYGGDYSAVQTIGYDVQTRAYTGTWIDNTMGYQWPLSGAIDSLSNELVINSSGPGPTGAICRFRERYQFKSTDSITIVAEMMQGEKWVEFMTTHLKRKGESDIR